MWRKGNSIVVENGLISGLRVHKYGRFLMKRISVLAFAAAVLVSGGAYAADLQIPATPDKAMAMAVPSGWDGFYAGVNAGYGWANRTGNSTIFGIPTGT